MRVIEKTTEILSIFFLSLATILIAFNVTARYVFNYGAPWCEEAIRYSIIFATFFGLSLSVAKNDCMKIDLLIQLTKGKIRRIVTIIGTICEFTVIWTMVYCSYLLVIETYQTGQITPSTDYPMYIPYVIVAFGVVLCAIRSAQALLNALKMRS